MNIIKYHHVNIISTKWGTDIIDEDEILEELISQFGTRYYFNTEQFIDERYLDNPPNCWWTNMLLNTYIII